MTITGVPPTGTLNMGAKDSTSGDWYILVTDQTMEISIQSGENISGEFPLSVYVTSTNTSGKSTTSVAQVIDFVVTPVADDTFFIRAPRFIFENSDGSLILEDQANPIEIPLSIELPDGGETIEDVVIKGLLRRIAAVNSSRW